MYARRYEIYNNYYLISNIIILKVMFDKAPKQMKKVTKVNIWKAKSLNWLTSRQTYSHIQKFRDLFFG